VIVTKATCGIERKIKKKEKKITIYIYICIKKKRGQAKSEKTGHKELYIP